MKEGTAIASKIRLGIIVHIISNKVWCSNFIKATCFKLAKCLLGIAFLKSSVFSKETISCV